MRIRELNLIRYGKFTDHSLSLPANARDIHLIVGPNEAGKSTVRTAIGDWLFGIPMRTPLAFLHPMPELRLGGVLEQIGPDPTPSAVLAFERTKGNKNTLRGSGDTVLPDATLQPWLGSLQATAFNRMYALDHTTLVEGGAGILSAADDVGRLLFQSAAGIEHLGDALRTLQEEADALWGPRKAGARTYYQAQELFDKASAELKQVMLRTRDWKSKHDELTETESALVAARTRDLAFRQQLSRLERMRRVRPILLSLDAALSQRCELLLSGERPLLPENSAQELSVAEQELVLNEADRLRLEQELAQNQNLLQSTRVDESLLGLAPDITELNERRLQFRAHATDIVKRTEEVRMAWLRAQELASGLGWPCDGEGAVRQRLPALPVRSRLLRLLKDRPAVAQDLRTARSHVDEREQQVQQVTQALQHLSAAHLPVGLATLVEQAEKLGDHAAVVRELNEKIEVLKHRIETGLQALGTWRQDAQALGAMVVPEPSSLEGLIDQQRSDAADLLTLREMLQGKQQDMRQQDMALERLVRDFQPVSLDQVLQVRQSRDHLWLAIKSAPQELGDHAPAFEQRITEADNLSDARLDRAQHEADRQAQADRLAQMQSEAQGLASRIQGVEQRMEARKVEWEGQARACGLPALPLDMAPVWIRQRATVLELVDAKAETLRQLAHRQEAAAQLQQALGATLGGSAQTPLADLTECVRLARAEITRADQAQGQRATLERQLEQAQSSVVASKAALQVAHDSWNAWSSAWQMAIVAGGYETTAAAERVEAELEGMQEVERLLTHIRSIRSERIDTMQADLQDLAATAKSLAERAAPDLVNLAAPEAALELASRLEQAKRAASVFAELQARLERTSAALATAQQKQIELQMGLAPLLAAAGVEDVSALRLAIERSEQRRDIERQIQEAEGALAQASDGLSTEALREETADFEPDGLIAQLQQLEQQSADVVGEIATLSNAHGTLKASFDTFDGTDAAAKAEARKQEAVAAMADAAERYLKVQTASRLLSWSMEKFRETQQGPMLGKASAIFSGLTGGSFDRLLVESEGASPRLTGVRPTGEQVGVEGMSEGSRDQLYLALRLSALALQIEQGITLPLIADDLFINFDDKRTAAGLHVLGELSQKMQIIFLTHHDHLVPLAKEVLGADLNVVYL